MRASAWRCARRGVGRLTLAVLPTLLPAPLTAQSVARVLSADSTFFAEGIDADPRDGSLYVTSLRHRNVLVVPSTGTAHFVLQGSGHGAVMGVAVDTTRDLLWLTTANIAHMRPLPADSSVRAELLRVSLRDGRITRRWQLGDGSGIPGEITLTPSGDVLVSDGIKGLLYRLRPGAERLESLADSALRSPQGIAVRPDGRVAYVADWSRGLLAWDLETGVIAKVATPEGEPLRGMDGLRWWRDGLLAVQNGRSPMRVLALALSEDGRAVQTVRTLDLPSPADGEATVGAVLGDRFVYVASSAWPFWTDAGERRAVERPLPPVVLREVRLDGR